MPLFTPRLPLIGTNGTVTTSTPLLDLSQTWNNVAVGFTGVKISITNTASAGNSYLFDVLMGGTSRLNVQSNGTVNIAGDMAAGGALYTGISGSRVVMFGSADGVLRLTNGAATDFNRLQFGGTTSSFPSLKRSGQLIAVRLADDSGLGTFQSNIYYMGSGSRLSDTSDGNVLFQNNAGTDFSRLLFGGTSSSFPALKRSGANLLVRLADDTGLTALYCSQVVVNQGTRIYDSGDGILTLTNSANTNFTRLQFGGTTNAFPSISRSGNGVQMLLADGSASTWVSALDFRMGFGTKLRDTADGLAVLTNAAQTDFSRLMFGGTTSAFPALKRSGVNVLLRLADDSGYTDLYARTLSTDPKTVATLPAAASAGAGARSYVTDATLSPSGNFGQPVTGGGANGTVVWSNGSGWLYG